MTTSPRNGDDHPVPPSSSTVILLMLTIADTTWRLFVPSVGAALAGLLLDRQLHTKPWLTVASTVIGAGLAVWLVWLQMKKVKKL